MSKPNFKVCLECPLEHCVEEWTKEISTKDTHRLPSREIELSQISRLDVARAVHCVPKHISGIFMGKSIPSLPLAYDIAKYLGTTIDHLYQAISGANGTNPRRQYKGIRNMPKYLADGKGYRTLREALLSLGIEKHYNHYFRLPDELKSRVKQRDLRGSYADKLPQPKYSVNGKGYQNLYEALLSIGIDRVAPRYHRLPDEVKARIVKQGPFSR